MVVESSFEERSVDSSELSTEITETASTAPLEDVSAAPSEVAAAADSAEIRCDEADSVHNACGQSIEDVKLACEWRYEFRGGELLNFWRWADPLSITDCKEVMRKEIQKGSTAPILIKLPPGFYSKVRRLNSPEEALAHLFELEPDVSMVPEETPHLAEEPLVEASEPDAEITEESEELESEEQLAETSEVDTEITEEPAPAAPAPADFKWDEALQTKLSTKYHDVEKDVIDWMEAVIGETKGEQSVFKWLQSGVRLCALVNAILPGSIKYVHTREIPAFAHENIAFFVNAVRKLGVAESSVFSSPDLYENKNVGSVVSCIYSFAGVVQVLCPEFHPKLGRPITTASRDVRRKSVALPDLCAGLASTMEVQRPTEHVDYLRDTSFGAQRSPLVSIEASNRDAAVIRHCHVQFRLPDGTVVAEDFVGTGFVSGARSAIAEELQCPKQRLRLVGHSGAVLRDADSLLKVDKVVTVIIEDDANYAKDQAVRHSRCLTKLQVD